MEKTIRKPCESGSGGKSLMDQLTLMQYVYFSLAIVGCGIMFAFIGIFADRIFSKQDTFRDLSEVGK